MCNTQTTFHHKNIPFHGDFFSYYKNIARWDSTSFQQPVLLDSSKANPTGDTYSIIGCHSYKSFTSDKEGTWVRTPSTTTLYPSASFLPMIQDELDCHRLPHLPHTPMTGGCIGFFSYDYTRQTLSIDLEAPLQVAMPDAVMTFFDTFIIYHHEGNCITLISLGITGSAVHTIDTLIQLVPSQDAMSYDIPDLSSFAVGPMTSPFSQDDYEQRIQTMMDYMENGHIYVGNMTQTFSGSFTGDSLPLYERLRRINPAPFSAYLPYDDFCVLSSSPERFFNVQDGLITTRPIKGTVPRGTTPELDLAMANQLQSSEKDKSELLMIVDLERNDLSKICIPGTVHVPELFKLEAYATVFHLVSTVTGTLKPTVPLTDTIPALFPGGSITGAPKRRAVEIIDELEAGARHLYTGCIGYFGFNQSTDFNIVIRTLLINDHRIFLGVGGGITWESNTSDEYTETLDKANALFKALGLL